MLKLEYKDLGDVVLERKLWEYNDVFNYVRDRHIDINMRFCQSQYDDEKQKALIEEDEQIVETSVWNLFAKVYNETSTNLTPENVNDLINEMMKRSKENSSNSIQKTLAEFLKLLKEASETPPKQDKLGAIDEMALHKELLRIVYLPY